jgi:hypothetical protein
MSKRTNGSSVLTANRLSDGRAVFLDFEGAWGESIDIALAARTTQEIAELEARGAFDAAQNLVVEPYLVEVRETEGRLVPVRQRERVRAGGPSILDDVPGYLAPAAVLRHAQHEDPLAAHEFPPRGEPVEPRAATAEAA